MTILLGKESGRHSIDLMKDGGLQTHHLNQVQVGLGWDPNREGYTGDFDLDASALVVMPGQPPYQLPYGVRPTGLVALNEAYFVFHRNRFSPDGAIRLDGDDRSGHGAGPDESLLVNLGVLPREATGVIFIVNVHAGPTFRYVRNAFVNVFADNREVTRYDLDDDPDARDYRTVVIGAFRRASYGAPWFFDRKDQGYQDLQTLLSVYGLAA